MTQKHDYDIEGEVEQWENEGGALLSDPIEVLHVPLLFLDIQRRLAAIEVVLGLRSDP